MPPRRSCFRQAVDDALLELPVSMPPRRSCFLQADQRPGRRSRRFNATTAFLLRMKAINYPPDSSRFNATTAFLLPKSAPSGSWDCLAFQCHHGVPASAPTPTPRPVLG